MEDNAGVLLPIHSNWFRIVDFWNVADINLYFFVTFVAAMNFVV